MPKQIQASMTVRWMYIIVALVVLAGLGYWLYSTYNVTAAPATAVPSVSTTGTNPN